MKIKRTLDELAADQFHLEAEMKSAGLARFEATNNRSLESNEASGTQWNRRIIAEMTRPMAETIQAYLDEYKGKRGKPSKTLTYLRLLEPKVAAYVAIKVVLDHLARESSLLQMALAIGSRIEDQVRFSRLHDSAPNYIKAVQKSLRSSNTRSYQHGHVKMGIAESSLVEDQTVSRWSDWPKQDKVQLGSRLIEWLSKNVTFQDEPIITITKHTFSDRRGVTVEPSETMQEWVNEFKQVVGDMSPAYAPCVVPPRDWTSPYNGGYYVPEVAETLPLVKSRRSHVKKLTRKQMPKVYKAINAAQAVRWTVNSKLLEIADNINSLDLGIGMPQREPFQSEPFPFDTDLVGRELVDSLDEQGKEKLATWKADRVETLTRERKRKASVLEFARTFHQAKKYDSYEAIHFVYTMDFRSRVYAQATDLSPQGGDIGKALVHFADGMELGKEGAYWLAVHGANVWGNDKVSFDERVQWVRDNEDDILDYAADPITHQGWTSADKPWQFLAFCLEWSDLTDHIDSCLTCETFVSHLAVAMDGSCSGIQHYSAMLRDKVGGAAVNLVPDTVPHDIYGDVAGVARSILAQQVNDAHKSDEELAIGKLAEQLLVQSKDGKDLVDRNCCKRPVMTLPYGSTRLTCLDAIQEHFATKGAWAGHGSNRNLARHLSPVVWDSIGEVVKAAREGMNFIRLVNREVAKRNMGISWPTPTGFIVEQSEYKMEERRVDTQLLGRTTMSLNEETQEICSRSMQASGAPNFVHSMDASHLLLSICGFVDAGITSIAVIHDSFGTHAGNTGTLRFVLINTFVDMYMENNVLEELMLAAEALVGEDLELELPMNGNLDLEDVRNSPYAFA